MNDDGPRGYETPATTDAQPITDGGRTWTDLSGRQKDVLVVVAAFEACDDDPSGIAIKREFERRTGESINKSGLYPALEALVDYDLVEKGVIDQRTNSYELTGDGERLLVERHRDLTEALRATRDADADRDRLLADGGSQEAWPPIEEMTTSDLREQYRDLRERLATKHVPHHEADSLWERTSDLWSELRDRVDVEMPPCPDCNTRNWGQTAGEPIHCASCGKEGVRDDDLRERIQTAWDTIMFDGEETA